jgi:hypothetical protein
VVVVERNSRPFWLGDKKELYRNDLLWRKLWYFPPEQFWRHECSNELFRSLAFIHS